MYEFDNEKFKTYDELISHTRHYHHPIVKCRKFANEFVHELDRLQHVREGDAKEVDYRPHKDSHKTKKKDMSPLLPRLVTNIDMIQCSEMQLSKLQFSESPIFVYTVSAA